MISINVLDWAHVWKILKWYYSDVYRLVLLSTKTYLAGPFSNGDDGDDRLFANYDCRERNRCQYNQID